MSVCGQRQWRKITASEAGKLYPEGTVSAHSGLFVCELCGQYVILTDGRKNVRYFKHSAYDTCKDCPERTTGLSTRGGDIAGEHELPIRLSNITTRVIIYSGIYIEDAKTATGHYPTFRR